jgi:hypothetical protein
MRAHKRIHASGALGLCLLSVPLLRLAAHQPAACLLPARRLPTPPSPSRAPFEQALWEARSGRFRAQLTVNQERYALEAWDPQAAEAMDQEQWRRQLMAADPRGHLRHARAKALWAAALARSPDEAYRVTELLARLECDTGHHEAELVQARKLMALEPYEPLSLMALRRAAGCNRQETLVRWAEAALEELPEAPAPPIGGTGR